VFPSDPVRILCLLLGIQRPDDIRAYTPRKRLETTSELLKHFNATIPADPECPDALLDEGTYAPEILALRTLASSLMPSDAYIAFVESACDMTAQKMARDVRVIKSLRQWHNLSPDERISIFEKLHAAYSQSFERLTGIPITKSPFEFQFMPGKTNPKTRLNSITRGYFIGDMRDDTDGKRSITFNSAAGAGLDCPHVSTSVGIHEITHDHGFQMGYIFKYRGRNLIPKILKEDATLYYMLFEYGAIIPSRYYSAYRAQFHERIARHAQGYMEYMLERHIGVIPVKKVA
jgi:hypothetical protein